MNNVEFKQLLSFEPSHTLLHDHATLANEPCIMEILFNHYLKILRNEALANAATEEYTDKLFKKFGK